MKYSDNIYWQWYFDIFLVYTFCILSHDIFKNHSYYASIMSDAFVYLLCFKIMPA